MKILKNRTKNNKYIKKLNKVIDWCNEHSPLSRLDRYIIGKFLGTYFFSITLIISIAVVFDFNENIDNKYKEFNFDYEMTEEDESNEDEVIVKRKKLEMKPMDEEEAILELELLGHDFFIYKDVHTNEVNVLYKRKDGNYGVIETND